MEKALRVECTLTENEKKNRTRIVLCCGWLQQRSRGWQHCTNSTLKDEVLRRKWTKFVQLDRADFGSKFGTTNRYSAICCKHFSADCYPLGSSLINQLGFKAKRNLLAGSIPTIRPSPSVTKTTVTVAVSSSTLSSCSTTASCSPSGPSLLPGVKKVRRACRKRVCSRVCTFCTCVRFVFMSVLTYMCIFCHEYVCLTLSVLSFIISKQC